MLLNVEENDAVVVVVCIESGDKFIAVTIPVIKVVVTKLEIPTPVPVVVDLGTLPNTLPPGVVVVKVVVVGVQVVSNK